DRAPQLRVVSLDNGPPYQDPLGRLSRPFLGHHDLERVGEVGGKGAVLEVAGMDPHVIADLARLRSAPGTASDRQNEAKNRKAAPERPSTHVSSSLLERCGFPLCNLCPRARGRKPHTRSACAKRRSREVHPRPPR